MPPPELKPKGAATSGRLVATSGGPRLFVPLPRKRRPDHVYAGDCEPLEPSSRGKLPGTATPSSSAIPRGFEPEILERCPRRRSAFTSSPPGAARLTAGLVIRLHGPDGPCGGSYGGAALRAWVKRIAACADNGIQATVDAQQ